MNAILRIVNLRSGNPLSVSDQCSVPKKKSGEPFVTSIEYVWDGIQEEVEC